MNSLSRVNPWVIYGLHAGDGVIRYVGMTECSIGHRFAQHLRAAKSDSKPVYEWIRSIGIDTVQCSTLQVVSRRVDLSHAETQMIIKLLRNGNDLLNVSKMDMARKYISANP